MSGYSDLSAMLTLVVINIFSIVCFFFVARSTIVRVQLLINYLLLLNPILIFFLFGYSHPLFVAENENNILALIFILFYNFTLWFSFILFMRTMPSFKGFITFSNSLRINLIENGVGLATIVTIFALLVYTIKFYLDSLGAFKMLDPIDHSIFGLQLLKVFAHLDLLIIIYLGELRLRKYLSNKFLNFLLLTIISISLYFAFFSGSRVQVVILLLVTLISFRDIFSIKRFIFALPLLPVFFLIFPFLSLYLGKNHSFTYAWEKLNIQDFSFMSNFFDILVTRLNYFEPLVRVIDYVYEHKSNGGEIYLNNLIGLVPRFIWPEKPLIGNNGVELGHKLEMLTINDNFTSIGLQGIGEAFYELAWLGIVIGVFLALLFWLIQRLFYVPSNPVSMSIYIYLILYIVQRDAYFALIPGLVLQLIGIVIFFGTLSFLSRFLIRLK